MEYNFCGQIFRPKILNSDMWKSIQLPYPQQFGNRSPWENNHKYQLVKPILMKPMFLEQGQVIILHTNF